MSFTIECIFDQESGIDGMDPLGKLAVSDGSSEISIDPTFFDSWLAALVEVLPRLRTTNHVVVEIPEEPKSLAIEVASDGRLILSYDGQLAVASAYKEFEFALRVAVSKFLDTLNNSPESFQNQGIEPIRRFFATNPN
jgi:hypothetical protein